MENGANLTPFERELLTLIQKGFPLEREPFKVLAKKLLSTEEEILKSVGKLKEKGHIRRIGAIFDSRKLGYASTLCAMKVPEEKLASTAQYINSLPEVTHNYLRHHEFNMWFTLISTSEDDLKELLSKIQTETGITDLLNLPATKFFKINVNFNLKEGGQDDKRA